MNSLFTFALAFPPWDLLSFLCKSTGLRDKGCFLPSKGKRHRQESEDRKVAYDKAIEEMSNKTKNKAAILRYNEAAD